MNSREKALQEHRVRAVSESEDIWGVKNKQLRERYVHKKELPNNKKTPTKAKKTNKGPTQTRNQTTATTAVVQNATKNNPFYKSIGTWIKANPKTAYTALASLFSAPVLYSMFGGSEDAPSDTGVDGSNADTINNYKLLANKAKQDINKEYAAAHNSTTGTNTDTNTQSATQNADSNLKQLNELSTRVDANMAKLKTLEAETLRRISEQQANQKLPQKPQSGNEWGMDSADIGIFDAPDNYTPILPNNPILPYTAIDINKGTNNLAENVVNASVGQGITPGDTTPEKKEQPVTGTNKGTGNAIRDAVKKKVNQYTKKNTNNGNTGKLNNSATDEVATEKVNEQPVMTPEQLAYEQAINASNGNESSAIIQDYYNRYGVKKSVDNPKTALSEAQRDYYRYLTGYRQMAPNQAILSMGLDPNKYYY